MRAPIPGYEGFYEISDSGEVFSLPRMEKCGKMTRRRNPKVIGQSIDKDGYRFVRICREGKCKTLRTHRLVLAAFVRQPQGAEEGCHINHDRADNRVVNLRWGTRAENERDKDAAERRGARAKLTWPQVHEIRSKYAAGGVTLKGLAAEYSVSFTAIWSLITWRTWSRPGVLHRYKSTSNARESTS